MKATWLSAHGGVRRVKFVGSKRRWSYGKELNNIILYSMSKALKINKKYKSKATDNSSSENDSDNSNFEKP